jgi:tripartite-type tricarboxylate transporter receptor subunit TctC
LPTAKWRCERDKNKETEMMDIRKGWRWAALALCMLLAPLSGNAQPTWPSKTVRLVVPVAPGGSLDNTARILAEHLTIVWKQPVIVDNRPGANTSLGAGSVARAAADGHTILLAPGALAVIKLFQKNPGFDPLKDLTPVSQVAQGDYVLLVHKDFPANSMAEFGAYARGNPTKVFYGAYGGGILLGTEEFSALMGFKAQIINYRGEVPAISAVIGGEIQAVFATLSAARSFVDGGRVKALGIPARKRSPIAPGIRSAEESGGKAFYTDFWFGAFVPAGTPEPVVSRISKDLEQVLARTDVKARMYAMGVVAKPTSPEEFARLVQFESERWLGAAQRAGIEPQ